MKPVKNACRQLSAAKWFEILIVGIILTNCILIGVETYARHQWIHVVQNIILFIFTFEITVRFIARKSLKEFFLSGWNNFDLFLVLISYVPESLFSNVSAVMMLRVLRIFRILRLLRTSEEIKLIVSVLSKSFSALFYNGIFFFIFLYLFSIVGVSLFKLPDYQALNPEMQAQYELFMQEAPNTPECSPEPYGTLSESMFTLFRALTGEDWTDLRYNLIKASEYRLIPASSEVITTFHIVWFVLAAFLLLNLVVGAIVNNYQVIMEESRERKRKEAAQKELGIKN
ncbi:MAG: ion transporter [Prevotellaceae bacterium]|jgi:voltage-gated sodium channel|nr:ion transporter [Prevotellaceae bacterium]